MRSLKVTAHVENTLAGSSVTMLDALMEHKMSGETSVRRELLARGIDVDVDIRPGLIPTPIVRKQVEGFRWPIPLCSSPIFRAASDTHGFYCQRFDVEPEAILESDRRVSYSNSGERKSYRLPLRERLIDRVVWFCVVGDAHGVKEMRRTLDRVDAIGKKTSHGNGRVRRWEVEDVADDWSWFAPMEHGGRTWRVLMRPLPLAIMEPDVVGWRRWDDAIVPPYWGKQFGGERAMPC